MNVNLDPLPSSLLESLRSIGYTLDTALADLIDNSITAKAKKVSVSFLWNKGKPWIAVSDDGCGMTREELIEAMRFGCTSPSARRAANDLGRFGLGMKTASISQCRRMTVLSKQAGAVNACEWNLDAISSNGYSAWNALFLESEAIEKDSVLASVFCEQLEACDTGTVVVWQNLDGSLIDPGGAAGERRFSAQMDTARRHLELVFHRYLKPAVGEQKLTIVFNGSALEAFDPFGPSVPSRQELPAETIHVQGHSVSVQPYVLPHRSKAPSIADYERFGGDEGYLHNQGFYIYRNRRLIIKATWFRLIPKDELNKLIRVRVDVPNALDHLWRIDVKKSHASPPEIVRNELKRVIHRISGAGRIVFTNRATRIKNRRIIPVWKRQVVDGRVHYGVNEDHPLVQSLLQQLPKAHGATLRACFELLSSTFPYDVLYADAADDKTEFDTVRPDEETVRQVGIQLVKALRTCGHEGEQLRKQIQNTEFFKCSPELLEEILRMEDETHEY